MRNKIIFSLLILFILFLAGSGLTMLYLYNTTSNLQSVIDLHRVEIIRQDLVISAQTVQSHLYSFGTAFGKELDVIVENVIDLDNSARRCLQCHHNEEITQRLEEVVSLVEQYQDALSYLITTSANKERIERLRMVAIGIGTTVLSKAQEMAIIAGQKLNEKTYMSLQEINNSRVILLITLVLSFFIAIAIAVTMTRQITEPIYELVDATRRIQGGDLGYTTHYRGKDEFGELIDSFNEMSLSLDESNRKIMRNLNSLSNLYSMTLGFHSLTDVSEIYRELSYGAADLVGAEQCGLLLLDGDHFVHVHPAVGVDRFTTEGLVIPKNKVLDMYVPQNRRALVINGNISSSPTAELDRKVNTRNLIFVWVRQKADIVGIIRVANKKSGEFTPEDVHPLAILANNVSVALENAKLYDDLRRQMQQLKDAQEQLIQAAKLVAIGELASNVAHELNNPLTSVLGYAELMKEEKDIEGMLGDLDVIEKECLRAKDIIRQLLEFSRKRELKIVNTSLADILRESIDLIRIQTRNNRIKIEEDIEPSTSIMADPNQLKQVFLNLFNNAFHAMGDSGTLSISVRTIDGSVHTKIADTGKGISEEHLPRIFEPFFSTKQDKGTGIGLSVSYKIIQSHNGRIEVESKENVGTTFTVILPSNVTEPMPS